MKLKTIVDFLNIELKVKSIADSSRNGLQFRASNDVKKIAFAVDNSLDSFKKALDLGCDLLIVHHGLLWKDKKYIKTTNSRLRYLKKNSLSLYAVHLPLDLHPVYGNNAELCKLLDVNKRKKWGSYHGFPVGFKGVASLSLSAVVKRLNAALKTRCKFLSFGPNHVRRIGIMSGGGGFALDNAIKDNLDTFVVGEISHSAYYHAKESRINVIIAGHYATETVGVKALAKLLNHKFNIETVFIDLPTGL